MPFIAYEQTKFKPESLERIQQANAIIEAYAEQGYDLTLRQLYYQFVSRDLIPNRDSEYKKLGDVISKARRAGLIDWNAIVDRTRNLRKSATWTDPSEIVAACAAQFRLDKRHGQDTHVEVWIEKDALVGVFERPCTQLQVGLFACRGYTSDSEIWAAAQRIRRECLRTSANGYKGRKAVILHFGDHDPSGIDMTRDIRERLALFGAKVEVHRLALNMDQIEEYAPPPNPAKVTDSRFQGYESVFGSESWELDALEPTVLDQLVRDGVAEHTDAGKWGARAAEESAHRKQLRAVSAGWHEITSALPTDDEDDDEEE